MARATLREKGQLTVPPEIRRAAHLEEGDIVEFEITAMGILLHPKKVIDATQAWFWQHNWQDGELEAEVDVRRGRYETYDSGDEFLASLDG